VGAAAAVAVATGAAALAEEASAEVTWVASAAASAEVTRVASAELTWEVLAEVAMVMAMAEVTMALAMAEVTMAMEDTTAMDGAGTVTAITTALVARITRHTDGLTPAPTEW
jgi:hypothetical protein